MFIYITHCRWTFTPTIIPIQSALHLLIDRHSHILTRALHHSPIYPLPVFFRLPICHTQSHSGSPQAYSGRCPFRFLFLSLFLSLSIFSPYWLIDFFKFASALSGPNFFSSAFSVPFFFLYFVYMTTFQTLHFLLSTMPSLFPSLLIHFLPHL